MEDELFKKLQEYKDTENFSRISATLQSLFKKGRENIDEETKKQKFKHRGKMFWMVFAMTIITYTVVLFIILSQVILLKNADGTWTFKVLALSDQRLGLILTGFLAELLLLPKIILTGLFKYEDGVA